MREATSSLAKLKPAQASGIDSTTPSTVRDADTITRSRPSRAPRYATRSGDFARASTARQRELTAIYLESKRTSLATPPPGEVSRVERRDLAVDLESATPEALNALLAHGDRALSKACYFTSGAGLWSRGGGQVKALVPLNLGQLLDKDDLVWLDEASKVVNARSPADVLLMVGEDVPEGDTVEKVAERVVDGAKRAIEEIVGRARADDRALPPIALKFVNVAMASKRAKTYVPFDIWTSEQTHEAIFDYVQRFRATYPQIQFDPDPQVQSTVVEALREYFDRAAFHGHSNVFGFQRGLHALDPETGRPLEETALIGEGAGRAKAYLDESGRTGKLLDRGTRAMVFDNIEVLTDLRLVSGAHARAGKAVSVVVVPQRDGYAGGNPLLVNRPDGTESLELHEQSALPAQFATGNAFFNANTIVEPLDASPPEGLGFEVKNNGTQIRVKQNAGDITHALPTAGIGGRLGIEYENLKTYAEYRQNGCGLIDTFRQIWRRDAL